MYVILPLGLLFAATMILVVVPSLYIGDLDHDDHQPPNVYQLNDDAGYASGGVRQRLFLLFMIPGMAMINAVATYMCYYRHVRNVHYRMEVNEMANASLLVAGKSILQHFRAARSRSGSPAPRSGSLERSSTLSGSMIAREGSFGNAFDLLNNSTSNMNASVVLAALPSAFPGQSQAGELQLHHRPDNVAKDSTPIPYCSDVSNFLQSVDSLLDEASHLRRRVARVLLTFLDDQERRQQALASAQATTAPDGLTRLNSLNIAQRQTIASEQLIKSRPLEELLQSLPTVDCSSVTEADRSFLITLASGSNDEVLSAIESPHHSPRGHNNRGRYEPTDNDGGAAVGPGHTALHHHHAAAARGRARAKRGAARVVFTRSKSRGRSESHVRD